MRKPTAVCLRSGAADAAAEADGAEGARTLEAAVLAEQDLWFVDAGYQRQRMGGWGRVGPSGASHFVKMIRDGIEYGLLQAYAEGFDIMQAQQEFDLDLHQLAENWRFGSVVRS